MNTTTKTFKASDSTGEEKTWSVGDKVTRRDGSADIVRMCFMQETLLEPYARNTVRPAVVLTEVSWEFCSDVSK